jgi:hypothetical protein
MKQKGYKLSTNYSLLWDLIKDSYTIVGYILWHDKWVLIEIKFNTFTENYYLGGYENSEYPTELNTFRSDCEDLKLKYILAKMED